MKHDEKRQKFPDQPHNVPMKKDRYGNRYYLAHAYEYDDSGITVRVDKNFRYDGASVPRLAWTFSGLRPDGLLRAAALIHDIIYIADGKPYKMQSNNEYFIHFKTKLKWKRKDADKLFLKIMLESGVSKWRARLAYRAVRIGGGFLRNF